MPSQADYVECRSLFNLFDSAILILLLLLQTVLQRGDPHKCHFFKVLSVSGFSHFKRIVKKKKRKLASCRFSEYQCNGAESLNRME